MQYKKRSIFHIEISFTLKKYDLLGEKLKNQIFLIFKKIDTNHLSSSAYFINLYQKISKLSSPVLWKGFEIKSYQRRTFLKYQKKMLQLKVANLKKSSSKFATISCIRQHTMCDLEHYLITQSIVAEFKILSGVRYPNEILNKTLSQNNEKTN